MYNYLLAALDTNNTMTRKKKNNYTRNSTKITSLPADKSGSQHSPESNVGRRNFILALCGLVIGIFGGVPGFLSIKNYYNKSSVRIMFDEKESMPCFIANSPRTALNGKFAVLLYRVTIVGKGNHKFVAYDVNVSIRANGVWYEGVRFKPVQRDVTDRNGWTGPAVQIHVGVTKPSNEQKKVDNGVFGVGDTLNITEWRDFDPGINVGFGEPATFMVAAYFPKAPHDAKNCDRLRIVVRDYLGNTYTEEIGTAGLKKPQFDLFLDQSPKQSNRK